MYMHVRINLTPRILIATFIVAGPIVVLSSASPATQSDTTKNDAFFKKCDAVASERVSFTHTNIRTGKIETYHLSKRSFDGSSRAMITKILTYARTNAGLEDDRMIAYILGTAYRESAGSFLPAKEAPSCKSDDCRIKAVQRLVDENPKKYPCNYAKRQANGQSYYGRGFIQLTGPKNYKRIGTLMQSNLYDYPDLAVDPDGATRILIEGMRDGWFTRNRVNGKPNRLADYFNNKTENWIQARDIVNPGSRDNADITAGYAKLFLKCLG